MSFYNTLVGQLPRVQDSASEGVASLQDVVRLSRTHEANDDMSVD